MYRILALIICALMLTAFSAGASTLRVPAQYPTIQAGIDAAAHGDTVLVADGVYTGPGNKDIDFRSKQITVISENGSEYCTIDCQQSGRGFNFQGSETAASVLSGFRITGALTTGGSYTRGGGIHCGSGSSPTIENCHIVANTVTGDNYCGGGGIATYSNSNPIIRNCLIDSNVINGQNYTRGAGIYVYSRSAPNIIGCAIRNNTLNGGGYSSGGGIYIHSDANPTIERCVISNNSVIGANYTRGGGIVSYSDATPLILNCTIARNSVSGGSFTAGAGIYISRSYVTIRNTIVEGNTGSGGGVNFSSVDSAAITYSDFYNNAGGNFTGSAPAGLGQIVAVNANGDPCDIYFNILLSPLFVNPAAWDYHLQETSPCIDAGDPASPLDPDSTVADIGALFFDQRGVSPLVVTAAPHNTPIIIPAGGGMFSFTVSIQNTGLVPAQFDAWTEAVLPNGAVYGPIVSRNNLLIPPGATISRDLNQAVPGYAPPGNYLYIANAMFLPDSVTTDDSFPFTKLAGDVVSPGNEGWECYGWDYVQLQTDDADRRVRRPGGTMSVSPNPFNATTAISYKLLAASQVELVVYDIAGRETALLAEGFHLAGSYQAEWDASSLPSGVYFARLTAGSVTLTTKMLLVK